MQTVERGRAYSRALTGSMGEIPYWAESRCCSFAVKNSALIRPFDSALLVAVKSEVLCRLLCYPRAE